MLLLLCCCCWLLCLLLPAAVPAAAGCCSCCCCRLLLLAVVVAAGLLLLAAAAGCSYCCCFLTLRIRRILLSRCRRWREGSSLTRSPFCRPGSADIYIYIFIINIFHYRRMYTIMTTYIYNMYMILYNYMTIHILVYIYIYIYIYIYWQTWHTSDAARVRGRPEKHAFPLPPFLKQEKHRGTILWPQGFGHWIGMWLTWCHYFL